MMRRACQAVLVGALATSVGVTALPSAARASAKPIKGKKKKKKKKKKKTPEQIKAEEEAKAKAERDQRAVELFTSGKEKFDLGNFEGAIEDFEAAYELLDEPNLLYNIAQAYADMGDYENAVATLDRYREVAPESEHEMIEERRAEWQAEVDAKLAAADPTPASEEESGETESEGADSASDRPPRVFGVGPIVLTVVALGGIGAGIGLGVVSNRARNDAYDLCVDGDELRCQSGFEEQAEDNQSLALGANIAFGVGGAAALATVIWVSINASRRAKWKKRNATLSPSLGPRNAGLTLTGRF